MINYIDEFDKNVRNLMELSECILLIGKENLHPRERKFHENIIMISKTYFTKKEREENVCKSTENSNSN